MSAHPLQLVEQVDIRLLANLSENFRSPYEAILELVDNALAARKDDCPVLVTVTGSGGVGGTLRVTSKGGRGMGAEELGEFLRWGKAPDTDGLNRYGQGGKAAIGYLGQGMRIRCNRFDQDVAYQIEDHDWLLRPDGRLKRFLPHRVDPAVPGEGVVQIEILNLRRVVNLKRLAREIAWRYRPALSHGVLAVKIGKQRIDPAPLPSETEHGFRREVGGQLIEGWVGIAPSRFDGRGGVRCSAFGRVVLQHEYFGHRTSSFKASLNSLVGEVDLSFVPVVLNKNAFDTASPEWDAVQKVLYDELEPLVNQLLRRKDQGEPSDEERMRAMSARDVAARALDQIAAESAERGLGGNAAGRKPPVKRTEPLLRNELVPLVEGRHERQPRTPPPADAVGTLRRKGVEVDWDVRALDPHIRSAHAVESGRTEIIINSLYPLYRMRRGDLYYMVETGLLEQLRPTSDEEKSAEEYFEQVVEAVFLATEEIGGT